MEKLISSISYNGNILTKELKEKGYTVPDGELSNPLFFPLLSPEGSRARSCLISDAESLARLASGPYDYLNNLGMKVCKLRCKLMAQHKVTLVGFRNWDCEGLDEPGNSAYDTPGKIRPHIRPSEEHRAK